MALLSAGRPGVPRPVRSFDEGSGVFFDSLDDDGAARIPGSMEKLPRGVVAAKPPEIVATRETMPTSGRPVPSPAGPSPSFDPSPSVAVAWLPSSVVAGDGVSFASMGNVGGAGADMDGGFGVFGMLLMDF